MTRALSTSGLLAAVLLVAAPALAQTPAQNTQTTMLPPSRLGATEPCSATTDWQVLAWPGDTRPLSCVSEVTYNQSTNVLKVPGLTIGQYQLTAEKLMLLDEIDAAVQACRRNPSGVLATTGGHITCGTLSSRVKCDNGTRTEGETWTLHADCPSNTPMAGQPGDFTMMCTAEPNNPNGVVKIIASTCSGGSSGGSDTPSDPCAAANAAMGTVCQDGSIYLGAGTRPDTGRFYKLYAQRCDLPMTWSAASNRCDGTRGTYALENVRVYAYPTPPTDLPSYLRLTPSQYKTSGGDLDRATYSFTPQGIYKYSFGGIEACAASSAHGHNDWDVPVHFAPDANNAADELEILYHYRNAAPGTFASGSPYWTSTYFAEQSQIMHSACRREAETNGRCNYQNFPLSAQRRYFETPGTPSATNPVRCVRRVY